MATLQKTCSQHEEDGIHDARHRQRLARQKCDETDIILNGQSVEHTDTFKYLGVVLGDTYVRMKVSKMLGMFSRIRPSLTLEAANPLYRAMVLPVLDYCVA